MASQKHRFLQIYDRTKTKAVFALVLVGFFAASFGFDQIRDTSLIAAFYMVASVVFDIYEQTRKDNQAAGYTRFADASFEFRKQVDDLIQSNSDISIEWIGMTMEYGAPTIVDIVNSVTEKSYHGVASMSVVMIDPEWDGAEELNSTWPPRIRANAATLEDSLPKEHARLYYYAHVPNVHGFLLNDRHLYLGTCRWVGGDGEQKMTGGENRYQYFDSKSGKTATDEIANFRRWSQFCRQREALIGHDRPAGVPRLRRGGRTTAG